MDRFARQRLLAEVGDAGQHRLCSASYRLSTERDGAALDAVVERKYLERAGATRFVPRSAEPEPFAHAAAFQSPVALAAAAGAWRALRQIRAVLEAET